MQVAAREGPLERIGSSLIASLERHHGPLQFRQTVKAAWREQLPLDNGEVHLQLVEPARVDRGMNQNDIGPPGAKPLAGAPATMARAVVDDQEHAACRAVRLLFHDLTDQAMERCNAIPALAAAEQSCPVHIPRGEIGQRSRTHVFVRDVDRTPWCRRQGGMFPPPCLDARLLVDAEHVIPRPQRCTFPSALIQIDDPAGLAGKLRVTWKDPTAMTPGAQRVLAEPAPERSAADLRDNPARHRFLAQVGDGPMRERQAATGWQLTGQRLDRNHRIGGKSGLDARLVADLQGR